MKAKLMFGASVLLALVVINLILDLAGPSITAYVYSPGKSLGLVKSA